MLFDQQSRMVHGVGSDLAEFRGKDQGPLFRANPIRDSLSETTQKFKEARQVSHVLSPRISNFSARAAACSSPSASATQFGGWSPLSTGTFSCLCWLTTSTPSEEVFYLQRKVGVVDWLRMLPSRTRLRIFLTNGSGPLAPQA